MFVENGLGYCWCTEWTSPLSRVPWRIDFEHGKGGDDGFQVTGTSQVLFEEYGLHG
jgi:hypothetical protein